jgi:hypothetical protein
MGRTYDPGIARAAVADLAKLGYDATARKYNVTTRTIRNWEARHKSKATKARRKAIASIPLDALKAPDVRGQIAETVRNALARLNQLIQVEDDPKKVVECAKSLGSLLVEAEALGVCGPEEPSD